MEVAEVAGDERRRDDGSWQHDASSGSHAGEDNPAQSGPVAAAARIVRLIGSSGRETTVVALDGHGASGKSTIASALARQADVAVVETDSFFRHPRRDRPPSLADYYDTDRLRREALEPLRAGEDAAFRRYDWDRRRLGGATTVGWRPVVVLEGVFSASPLLADLVDLTVLVTAPEEVRLARLRGRISPEEWDSDWLAAETAYFSAVRPRESFDLVVAGAAPGGSR